MNSDEIAGTFIVLTQAATLHAVLLPHMSDLRQGDYNNPTLRTDVRVGQVAAAGLVIATGIIVGAIVNSSIPLWVSILSVVLMTGAVECVLRLNPRTVF